MEPLSKTGDKHKLVASAWQVGVSPEDLLVTFRSLLILPAARHEVAWSLHTIQAHMQFPEFQRSYCA